MMIDKLKAMSRDELAQLAATQGVKVHWNAKAETIIKAIVDTVSNPPIPQEQVDQRLKTVKEPVWLTREQIEEAIAPIKARVPEFEAIFGDDQTVIFRCKGAEDSLNLSVPFRWLMQKAQIVSRGRLAPMALNPHFESLNSATGKNAYTNIVLQ